MLFFDYLFSYSFGALATTAISILAVLLGKFLCNRIKFLKKFYIPAPVVGGLIIAIIVFLFNITHLCNLNLSDGTNISIKTLMMTYFFTSVGYMASIKDLKKGGVGVVIFLGVASLLIIFQNTLGIVLAKIFGVDGRYGLICSSITYTGGHGTASAWAETFGKQGLLNADTIGAAAATMGLIFGGLLGGPIARLIFKRHHLEKQEVVDNVSEVKVEEKLDFKKSCGVIFTILICMGISEVINPYFSNFLKFISNDKLSLPGYVLSMMLAAIWRNVYELGFKNEIASFENEKLGDIALQIFLGIALTTMNLIDLTRIDLSVIWLFLCCFVGQILITGLFIYFITFNAMGRDYDSCVICSGHMGFGLGATPTAIANMDAFCKQNGKSTKAYLVVPIVGAMFIDFTNALLISLFLLFV